MLGHQLYNHIHLKLVLERLIQARATNDDKFKNLFNVSKTGKVANGAFFPYYTEFRYEPI